MIPALAAPLLIGGGALVCKPSAPGEWFGATAEIVPTDDDIYGTSTNHARTYTYDILAGDFEWHFLATGHKAECYFGARPSADDGDWNDSTGEGATKWYVRGANVYQHGSLMQAITDPVGHAVMLARYGGVFALYLDGALEYAWPDPGGDPMRLYLGFGNNPANGPMDYDTMKWCE